VHIAATAAISSNSIKKLLFPKYILVEFTKYLTIAFRTSARHLCNLNRMVGYSPIICQSPQKFSLVITL
jgi:hypothetical protein